MYILFKNFNILPEFFFSVSILLLIIHCSVIVQNIKNKSTIVSIVCLCLLILFFCTLLFLDNYNYLLNSIYLICYVTDYLSEISKLILTIFSFFCLWLFLNYFNKQNIINQFEYLIILLISLLGMYVLCSSNDFFLAYLAIELQSLSFYVLTSFKKESSFSTAAGLKYFVLGAIASGFFLFGSSLLYGIFGSTSIDNFKYLMDLMINRSFDPSNTIISNILFNYQTKLSLVNMETELLFYQYCIYFLIPLLEECVLHSMFEFNKSFFDILCYENTQFYLILFQFFSQWPFYAYNSGFLIDYNYFSDILSNYVESSVEFFMYDIISLNKFYSSYIVYLHLILEYLIDFKFFFFFYPKIIDYYNVLTLLEFNKSFFLKFLCYTELQFLDKSSLLIDIALISILFSLFFKLAVFPVNFWLPDIYEKSLSSSTAFFIIVPKLSIFSFIIRLTFSGLFDGFSFVLKYFLLFLGLFSIIYGSILGLEERKLKSLLAFSAISNVGYLLMTLSTNIFSAVLFIICYLIIYMLANFCIWIILLLLIPHKSTNKLNKEISHLSNFYKTNKIGAFLFLFILFSIAGIPPFIGFLVKFGLFTVTINMSIYLLSILSILGSVIATFYYIRILKIIFFEKSNISILYNPVNTSLINVSFFLFFSLILLFFLPNKLYLVSMLLLNYFF